jgi:hypothetical protein
MTITDPTAMTAEEICEIYGGYWAECPQFSTVDWREAISADETRLGYWDWVKLQLEYDA